MNQCKIRCIVPSIELLLPLWVFRDHLLQSHTRLPSQLLPSLATTENPGGFLGDDVSVGPVRTVQTI
jgi:hypothetical protein